MRNTKNATLKQTDPIIRKIPTHGVRNTKVASLQFSHLLMVCLPACLITLIVAKPDNRQNRMSRTQKPQITFHTMLVLTSLLAMCLNRVLIGLY